MLDLPGKKLLAVLGLLLVSLLALPSAASADREFTPRFSANVPGDVIMASNTLMTCPPSAANCAAARAGGSFNNNVFAGQLVDVDDDPTTANSSRAQLDVPSGATVLFAGLYWGAR